MLQVLRVALKYTIESDRLEYLDLEVARCRVQLQRVLPEAQFVLCFHYLNHLVLTIKTWGPMPFYSMMRLERMMGYLTRTVRRRVNVEAHIVRNFQLFTRPYELFSKAKVSWSDMIGILYRH